MLSTTNISVDILRAFYFLKNLSRIILLLRLAIFIICTVALQLFKATGGNIISYTAKFGRNLL
jgi:hypothetical protein